MGDLNPERQPIMSCLPNDLPLQLTSFIGRSVELAEVQRLLSTTRLLTLTGVGGCGKTRPAGSPGDCREEVAEDRFPQDTTHNLQSTLSQPQFTEGVWLVELASLSDPALVLRAVAAALGLREAAGQPLVELLLNSLRSRAILILLDNCEHLLGACAQLAETLLRACPHLRILATSREALGLAGRPPG
jgi:predicted ATPase